MKIVHLETVKLMGRTLIRPAGHCGNCGSDWDGVMLSHTQARDHAKVRAAWNARNPHMRAVSVNAPIVEGKS